MMFITLNLYDFLVKIFNRLFFGIIATRDAAAVEPRPTKVLATKRKPFEHVAGKSPATTTGWFNFHNGTTDGGVAFIDYNAASGSKHNLNPQKAEEVTVTDIRHYDPPCELHVEGCTLVRHPSSLRESELVAAKDDKETTEAVKASYFRECADLVKNLTGATKTVPYHFRYRHVEDDTNFKETKGINTRPALLLHLDNNDESATATMKEYIGEEESAAWMKKHWMIINIWRPLTVPAIQYPLAVLDYNTFDFEKDQEPIYTRNNYKSNIMGIKPNPAYNLYYISNLEPEEALVFRNYDSKPEGTMIGLPHGAFTDNSTPKDAPPRRSIEVRVLALFDDE